MFQKIFEQVTWNKLDLMVTFMTLVLIMMHLMLVIFYTFTNIWWKKWNSIKMFKFVKQIFVSAIVFFGCNLSSVNPLEWVSMNNQESQTGNY